ISPTLLDFGPQAPGNRRDLGFTLSSCGAGTVELRGLVFDAGTSPEFSFLSKPVTPHNLPAGQSLQVTVRYSPTTTGPDFGRVQVLSNDARNPAAPVLLRGNASGCLTKTLSCAPASLTFPRTAVGQTSTLTFSCLNAGSQDVALSAIRLRSGTTPEFSLSHAALPPALAAGQSLRIAVDYKPTAAGADTGTVEIVSDDCQRPTQTVALSAQGVTPAYPKCIPPKTFSPVTRWEWRPTVETASRSVWMTPVVANLTDDNNDGRIDEEDIPDVIFTTHEGLNLFSGDPTPPGILRAIDGKTGAQLWNVTDPALRLNASAQLAVGDIDGDNKVEIIASLRVKSPGTGPGGFLGQYRTGRLLAFENDGTYKW
ncbi:MAG: choice-of-anchor D domain-containing protein, partial [Myxococcales bacterium]